MERSSKFCLFAAILLLNIGLSAQIVNCNPDEDFWIQIELPDGVEKVVCMTENTETNQMILATEMGLFLSDDNCETMIYANELSEGCWDIKYNDGYIYAITSNGRFCYKAVGSDWSFCDVPDAESCRCIFCASNGDVFLGAWNGIFKSIDNGKTWTHVYKTSATCLSKCLLESDKVILAGVIDFFESGRILRSVDGGDTWESVVNAPSNAIVRNSKGELFAGHYFAGMYDDNLSFSKSVDNGMTWEEVSESYPDVGSMVIDGDDVIYSSDSYKKSIYRTTDGGKSYQCIYDDNKLNSEIKLYISESGYLYAYFDETLLRSKEPLKTPAVISVPKEYCGNELIVYPNPAQGHVKIETGDISFIEVYSIRGQLVDKIDVNADVADIDMSGYNGGVYVFKVHANGKIYFSRTVKLNSGN